MPGLIFRIVLTAVTLLGLPCRAGAEEALKLPSGGSIRYTVNRGLVQLELGVSSGARQTLILTRDATVADKASLRSLDVVAEIPNLAVVIADAYPSIPGGMSFCKAGKESFLRIISTGRAVPVETLRIKLESCRDSVELASPGVEWDAAATTLRIHWLSGPSAKDKSEELTLRIGS